MRTGKARVLLIAAVAMIALVAFALPTPALADVPCRFYGPVQFNNENVPDGTVVSAWLEDPYIGPWNATAYLWQATSVYGLDVPPSFPGPGGEEGDTVHFSVTFPGEPPLPAPSSTWTQLDGAFVWHPLYLTSPQPPVAAFSATPLECCAPLEVHFTDESTGDPYSWEWDFGDGSAHSFVQNPIHTYTEPSTGNAAISRTVSLTATNAEGFDTDTKPAYITVHPPLEADFTATPTAGSPPLLVNFTDLSTGTITNWDWDFGDESPHSNVPNPSHTYTAVGDYTVSLTITGHGGSNTKTETDYIVVSVAAILEGHVDLQGRPSPPDATWITDLTVTFIEGTTVVRTANVTSDNVGNFTITDVDPGTYDICVKSPRALSQRVNGVVMVAGSATPVDFGTLREGDANNDDAITAADYSLLHAAFGSVPVDPNWNDNCDFNRNGAVEAGDYSLLHANFGQTGAC